MTEAIGRGGAIAVAGDDRAGVDVDVVIVGFHRDVRLRADADRHDGGAARGPAVATNDDATYPTPDGPIPVAARSLPASPPRPAVSRSIAGKPYEPMAVAVRALLGEPDGHLLVVGDRASTDGEFAVTLGCPFGLVRTGVTLPGDEVGVPVAIDAADFAGVVAALPPRGAPG